MAEGPVLEAGVGSETARIPEGHLPRRLLPNQSVPDTHQSSSRRGARHRRAPLCCCLFPALLPAHDPIS